MLVTDRNNSQVVWEKKKPTMRQSNCVSFAVWKYRAEHMNPCWSETQVIWSTDTDSAWGLCYCLTFTQWYFPVNIGCKLLLLSQHANLFWVFCFFLSWEACCFVRELSLVLYMMGAYELRYKYFMNVLNNCSSSFMRLMLLGSIILQRAMPFNNNFINSIKWDFKSILEDSASCSELVISHCAHSKVC